MDSSTLSLSWPALLVVLTVVAGAVSCQQESDGGGNRVPGGAGTGQVQATSGGDGDGDGGGGGGGGDDQTGSGCDTFPGPFGTSADEILDPKRSWEGFEAGETELGTISLASYALCGGGSDTKAIVVQVDAIWCQPCRDVAEGLAERNATDWVPAGVKAITLVVEDEEGEPADVEDAYRWRDQYGLEDLAVGFDPGYSLSNGDPDLLPQALIIDPRTMRIVARVYGNVGIQPIIDSVVAANQ